ncbi:MAG TPA: hypothetical protein VJP83_08555 [Terriglobales bacterium]|nr:hypothetical protein [Terriglobales bacterium]
MSGGGSSAPKSITNAIDQSTSFGKFSGLLTNPRVMQFALRYDF